ncbi:MAG: hypothetical protein RL684_3277 [Pseudomonadota bacterium]|jgi:2-polyprenyl-6-methoxyphenol hydroxylase-like FAD-dependent oxidoreductase
MAAVKSILIIGGGFSGMAAAIELRKLGLAVDLVEIDPGWRSYGAGISVGAPTLRAFRQLGILEAFLAQGHAGDDLELYTPDGRPIARLPTKRLVGPDIPGHGAIMRPVLAAILAQATRASGAHVRLGCTFTSLEERDGGVDVAFTDGTRGRYDLVIGADGLYSKVRETVLPGAPQPRYSGQAVWRAVVPRPPQVNTAIMWLGGPYKPGVSPVSQGEMYMYITENRPQKDYIEPAAMPAMMQALLASFTDPVLVKVRESIGPHSQVVFRPLEGLLVPMPWHRGRTVLIGDTVHATTPHMASGACIGIEDAIVLAQELARGTSVAAALQAFEQRRWERCRMVVGNSGRLGEIELEHGDMGEHARLMQETTIALEAPI